MIIVLGTDASQKRDTKTDFAATKRNRRIQVLPLSG